MWTYNYTPEPDELYHHGIKGMQWGKRRYQNPDGTLTLAGKKRYAKETLKTENKNALERQQNSLKKLQSSGRGNDVDAVVKISNRYDADRKAAREKYKAEKESIKAEKKAIAEKAEKDFRDSLNDYYKDDANYFTDKYNYGKRGIARISKDMDKGLSSTSAHVRELGKLTAAAVLSTAGTFAVAIGVSAIATK